MEEKIRWVREGAGARFDQLILNSRIICAQVAADPHTAAQQLAPEMEIDVDTLLESPFALLGTHQDIADRVLKLRDELGISYFTVNQVSAEELAPVVELLKGK